MARSKASLSATPVGGATARWPPGMALAAWRLRTSSSVHREWPTWSA